MLEDTHIVKGGYSFIVKHHEDFFEWLKRSHGSPTEFMALKPSSREKVFLRWKWGFTADEVNAELESTRRATLRSIDGMVFNNDGVKFYYDLMCRFEAECNKVRSKIGLSSFQINSGGRVASVSDVLDQKTKDDLSIFNPQYEGEAVNDFLGN